MTSLRCHQDQAIPIDRAVLKDYVKDYENNKFRDELRIAQEDKYVKEESKVDSK